MISLTKNLKTIFVFALGCTLATGIAYAGHESSGGGDQRCKDFYEMASELSISLAKIGQPKIDLVNPLIHASETRSVVMHPLQVLPVTGLDRQARSYPDEVRTDLDVEKWDKIPNRLERLALVAHELMVLTHTEADGEYMISRDLIRLISDEKANSITNQHKADHVTINSDGSYTFDTPKFGSFYVGVLSGLNDKTLFDGVCRYLGFTRETTYQSSGYKYNAAYFTSTGAFTGVQVWHSNAELIEYITCTDN